MDISEWNRVWKEVKGFSGQFPDAIVIGGVAVYLHSQAIHMPVEFTHDADFCVGLPEWSDIRDLYEVTINRRLSKHQIIIDDVEFDLYLEHHNGLRIDYGVLETEAVRLNGVRVAGLGHLLLLKLDAFSARRTSSHGRKDQRDIAKLLLLLEKVDPVGVRGLVTSEDMEAIERVLRSEAFMELTDGNAHQASVLRKAAGTFFYALRD
jgi:hypothetical protein